MRVEHKLSPAWVEHLKHATSEAQAADTQADILEGKAVAYRRKAEEIRQHIRYSITPIADAERLPQSKVRYALSDDCTSLIGEIDAPKESTDGPAT